MPVLLAIESSCDETAVAILRGTPGQPAEILASEVASQIDLHKTYGGVVPELASRNHSLHLRPLIDQALERAGVGLDAMDAFAATNGPGLSSSLLIGSTTAKALALAARKPFIAVNHLEGHLLSPFLATGTVPRHLALVVSGGHTLLLGVEGLGRYRRLGATRDDAAGEAFDKVAKMLGLPYPGGPEVERVAHSGNPEAFAFPRSMARDANFDFSFSGLKTAVLYTLAQRDPRRGEVDAGDLPDLCASFQQAVVDVLVTKTRRAAEACHFDTVAVSGGVSLNAALRREFTRAADPGRRILFARPDLCTDNAAMIAFAGLLRHFAGEHSSLELDVDPNLSLTTS